MIALQHHRGPDDRGLRLFSLRDSTSIALSPEKSAPEGGFEGGLAFARLSIIDLSEHGHQPMLSDDGLVMVAFNGEVYNAPDLKSELVASGHRFRGNSDTEVLLRLFLQHGLEGMLSRIEGMLAIAIVDMRAHTLTLIRDPVGIKPMLWTKLGNSVLFASEIKSLALSLPALR